MLWGPRRGPWGAFQHRKQVRELQRRKSSSNRTIRSCWAIETPASTRLKNGARGGVMYFPPRRCFDDAAKPLRVVWQVAGGGALGGDRLPPFPLVQTAAKPSNCAGIASGFGYPSRTPSAAGFRDLPRGPVSRYLRRCETRMPRSPPLGVGFLTPIPRNRRARDPGLPRLRSVSCLMLARRPFCSNIWKSFPTLVEESTSR